MKRVAICLLALLLALFSAPDSQAQLFKKKEAQPAAADSVPGMKRLQEVMGLVDGHYVENPNTDQLSEVAIRAMLNSLDPHSIYIPAKDVQRSNENLQGNFEGVGITYSIFSDTIVVGDVVAGGAAEKVGVMRGDKILRIDGQPATGDSVNNSFVMKRLRGKKGTEVVVDILRERDTIAFHIIRDKIPINSVDSYFMADDTIGYIRLLRFARTSVDEFRKALTALRKQGMTALVLDLRGNSGGFLDIACGLANEFISPGKLLVYQEGRMQNRQEFRANRHGSFRTGNLVVLIDENSASAAEIVSGAVQDWDRGTIIGRRSFGKGLVQRMYNLSDGGQVRITTARYYTPSGRCIQKPYDNGSADYRSDLSRRFKHGEMVSADSIHFPDSLKYKTANGRTVYGGGGIMPDIFIPMDTMRLSDYYVACSSKGLLRKFPQRWVEHHRNDAGLATFESYMEQSESLGLDSLFAAYAAEQGVVRDTAQEAAHPERTRHSDEYQHLLLKALVAERLYGMEYYFRVMKEQDDIYQSAITTLRVSPSSMRTR